MEAKTEGPECIFGTNLKFCFVKSGNDMLENLAPVNSFDGYSLIT